jgi:hypothetical protein
MKALFLTTAAFAALVMVAPIGNAHAGINCGVPNQLVGATGKDYVTHSYISIDPTTKKWSITHNLNSGLVVHRDEQYTIIFNGTEKEWSGGVQWKGRLNKNPSLWMVGEARSSENGGPTYREWLYDEKKGNQLVMQSVASCAFDGAGQQTASPVANVPPPPIQHVPSFVEPSPQPSAGGPQPPAGGSGGGSSGFAVALNDIPGSANVQYVNVTMGNGSVVYHMTLDTGCSQMSISNTLADWMLANGHATFIRNIQSTLADGSRRTSRLISVDQISLEGHVLTDVLATDGAPDQVDGSMLLGIGVLKRFGKFSIDTVGHQLVLG